MKRTQGSTRILSLAVAMVVTGAITAFAAAPAAPAAPRKMPEGEANALLRQPFSPVENGPAAAPAAGGGRGGAGFIEASVATRAVRSPEVSADHKITFRYAAPNAKQVQLQGDFTIHST